MGVEKQMTQSGGRGRSFGLGRILAISGLMFGITLAASFYSYGSSLGEGQRQVKLRLVRRDTGRMVRVTEFVGKMATISFESKDGFVQYGLVPNVDNETGAVNVVLHRIEGADPNHLQMNVELETIRVGSESPMLSLTADLPFGIMLEPNNELPTRGSASPLPRGFRPPNSLRMPVSRSAAYGPGVSLATVAAAQQGPERCCVTCDGVQTCACAVEADCGSCCAPKCCQLLGRLSQANNGAGVL